ncbi:MAG TPA: hypothetical protein O0X39_01000 [Methanocorpusculum sp.]|nr:hypothetical protein [Methanocorpusculum sp.]
MTKHDLQYYLICTISLIVMFLSAVAATGVVILAKPAVIAVRYKKISNE